MPWGGDRRAGSVSICGHRCPSVDVVCPADRRHPSRPGHARAAPGAFTPDRYRARV